MSIYDQPGITYDGVAIEGSVVQMMERVGEVWGRLGLDSSAPLVTEQDSISFGAVSMVVSENDTTVTVTRT